jgi:hypothetical protein
MAGGREEVALEMMEIFDSNLLFPHEAAFII